MRQWDAFGESESAEMADAEHEDEGGNSTLFEIKEMMAESWQ